MGVVLPNSYDLPVRLVMDEQIFAIQPVGGISRMFAELAQVFSSGATPDLTLLPFNRPIVNHYVLNRPELARALGAKKAASPVSALAQYLVRGPVSSDADIVHNTFYLPRGLGHLGHARRVITIHDMVPELLPHTRRRLDWMTLKQRYVEAANFITCVSEATKQDLIKVYGPPRAPIEVVHHGVDPRFQPDVPRADFLPDRYVLFVGHRHQYKDADVLFRAFALIANSHDVELLCVGGNGLTHEETSMLTELGIRERVSQRFLNDDVMPSAYAHADLFVFPSHFEGFGLPALEAMACGTPTLLARATSLPEVGSDAAEYFEPGDARDLACRMDEILSDDDARADLKRAGLARSSKFTWRDAASKFKAIYEEALDHG